MAVTPKHLYGWKMERILHPHLQEYLGVPLEATKWRFDGCDWKSESCDCELKARPPFSVKYKTPQDMSTYKTWVVPCCKADKFQSDSGRKLIFFYYWGKNQKVFRCDYTPDNTWERGVPFWSNQEHFFIPAEDWVEILDGIADTETV